MLPSNLAHLNCSQDHRWFYTHTHTQSLKHGMYSISLYYLNKSIMKLEEYMMHFFCFPCLTRFGIYGWNLLKIDYSTVSSITSSISEYGSTREIRPMLFKLYLFKKIHLLIWLRQVLVVACGIFSCGMWDLVPCFEGVESFSCWTAREVPQTVSWPRWTLLYVETICSVLPLSYWDKLSAVQSPSTNCSQGNCFQYLYFGLYLCIYVCLYVCMYKNIMEIEIKNL